MTFPVGEDAAIRRFYGEVLGIPEMPVPDEVAHHGWIWFATSDEGVELHFIPHAVAPDPERIHHFCLQVDDLAAVRERLVAAGVGGPRRRIADPGPRARVRARPRREPRRAGRDPEFA